MPLLNLCTWPGSSLLLPVLPQNSTSFLPSLYNAWEVALPACSSHYWGPVGRVRTVRHIAAGLLLGKYRRDRRRRGSVLLSSGPNTAMAGPCTWWSKPPLPSTQLPYKKNIQSLGFLNSKNNSTMGSQLLSKRNNTSILYKTFSISRKKKKSTVSKATAASS